MSGMILLLLSALSGHGQVDPTDESLATLLKVYRSDDGKARCDALEKLGELRRAAVRNGNATTAKAAEAVLLGALRENNDQLVNHASAALTQDAPRAKAAIPVLLELICKATAKSNLWTAAVFTGLRNFGPEAEVVVPALLRLVAEPTTRPYTRQCAIATLGFVGPHMKEVVPVIRAELFSKDREIKETAAWTLGRLGNLAAEATADLVKLLQNTDKSRTSKDRPVRWAVINALASINSGEDGVKCLASIIQDTGEHETDRVRAINAIAMIGPPAKSATPALLGVVKARTELYDTKIAAVIALRQIGPGARAVRDELRSFAEATKHPRLRQEIEKTLAALVGN